MKLLSPRPMSALVVGLLASGVSSAEDAGYLHLRTPGTAITARVTERDITGPDFQLSHSAEAMRGRAYGRVVSLQIEDERIGGLVGGLPVRLKLEREGTGPLKARGTFGGVFTRLELGPEELKGHVGRCGYELKAREQRYEGSRSCGGAPEYPVFVEIPRALANSGAPTTLAALALLLAQQ